LLVNFLFVVIIAILLITLQHRSLTAVELVYCAVYHIDHPVFTHLLSVLSCCSSSLSASIRPTLRGIGAGAKQLLD